MTLTIVQVGAPVLRSPARPLTKEEIRSQEIQLLIEQMRETMHGAPGVGLAAPQVGVPIQLVVIEDPAQLQARFTEQQLAERERQPIPFHVLINPQIQLLSDCTIDFFEGCLSIAGYTAITPRYTAVRVHALNERAEELALTASGWYARIVQHEVDHLNGTLYIDRCNLHTFSTYENKEQFWDK